jgi:hypothetical protein
MRNCAPLGCNSWYHFNLIVGGSFLGGIICSWLWKWWCGYFTYSDLDLIIKAISGIGTIIAGVVVYLKWQDEKTRQFYERRLQEVYAPLMFKLSYGEIYRSYLLNVLNRTDSDLQKNINPIVAIFPLHSGQSFDDEQSNGKLGVLKLMKLKSQSGLATPNLLKLTAKYDFLLNEQIQMRDDSLKKIGRTQETPVETHVLQTIDPINIQIEKEIVYEIQDSYNKCIKKLGLDDQKIDITQEDFWEKNT